MKKALKQKTFKKLGWCLVASRCGFITGGAWCLLAKPQLLWSCGYSRLNATLNAGFCYYLTSHYTGNLEDVQKNPILLSLQMPILQARPQVLRGKYEERTKFFSLEGDWEVIKVRLGQAGMARGQGKQGRPACAYKYSCICYLTTVGRLSAAFHNLDSPLPLFLWDPRLLQVSLTNLAAWINLGLQSLLPLVLRLWSRAIAGQCWRCLSEEGSHLDSCVHLFCYCCLLGGKFGHLKITISAPTVYFMSNSCQRMLVVCWKCPLASLVW